MEEVEKIDFGEPLHSFVIAGKMHILEAEILKTFACNPETFDEFGWKHQ